MLFQCSNRKYVNSNAFVSDKGLFRLLYCKFYCVDAMENFSANHSVLPISKLKQNLNLLKHSIVTSEDDFLKKIKKSAGSFHFTGLNLNKYWFCLFSCFLFCFSLVFFS